MWACLQTLSCGRNFPFRCEQQPKPQIYRVGLSTFVFFGALTIEANDVEQGKN
jgi:hypothetical protein